MAKRPGGGEGASGRRHIQLPIVGPSSFASTDSVWGRRGHFGMQIDSSASGAFSRRLGLGYPARKKDGEKRWGAKSC